MAYAGAGAAAGIRHHRHPQRHRRGWAPRGRAAHPGERGSLPAYIPKRRWFARQGPGNRAVSRSPMPWRLPGAPDVLLAEVETRQGGETDRYVLPIAIAWDSGVTCAATGSAAGARPRAADSSRRPGDRRLFAVDEFAQCRARQSSRWRRDRAAAGRCFALCRPPLRRASQMPEQSGDSPVLRRAIEQLAGYRRYSSC